MRKLKLVILGVVMVMAIAFLGLGAADMSRNTVLAARSQETQPQQRTPTLVEYQKLHTESLEALASYEVFTQKVLSMLRDATCGRPVYYGEDPRFLMEFLDGMILTKLPEGQGILVSYPSGASTLAGMGGWPPKGLSPHPMTTLRYGDGTPTC